MSLITLAILLFLSSCNEESRSTKAESTGKPSEILVVTGKPLWKSSAGDSIRAFFSGPAVGLPQPEPLYKLAQVEIDEFNRILQPHRNIFILEIDSSFSAPQIEMRRDVWAAPQRVVKITGASIEGIKSIFEQKKYEILNLYDNAEIERQQKLYSKSLNIKAIELIQKKFNLKMNIPADYYVAVDKDNFLWIRREANKLSQGLILYSYPYTDTIAFNGNKIKAVRNQFTELFVPGPSDSSYMIVADEFIEPVFRSIKLKDELAVETRGLWEVRKDFMGGPYISYTFVDRKNNMVVTLDGYVYAPNEEKRDLVKQVQAILLSFEFIEK
ncbi:MAG: DUF4837 family protein [Bacteroidales bacterium]|nr:DUF4837 family protein [Bacteroidales bacterium]